MTSADARPRRSRRRARGFAMPWAVAMLVVAGSVSALAVARVRTMHQATATDEADVRAVLAADGAIATARIELAADPAWTGACIPVGSVAVCTTVERTKEGRQEGWIVTARAGGSVVVQAMLRPERDRVPRVVDWQRIR